MPLPPVLPEWCDAFQQWLVPFLDCFRHKAQRHWAPLYLHGLLAFHDRRCATTMAQFVSPGDQEQLHHFVSTSNWKPAPFFEVLTKKADELVGGPKAHLIIDDTALVKKGKFSPGVGRQYCGQLGKKENCQSLVSTTLAQWETPVCIGLRLFLPESWDADKVRRKKCRIPEEIWHQPKWKIALEEIDRVQSQGARFGDVLAEAGYGVCGDFRKGLSARGFLWTVGITPQMQVYPDEVEVLGVESNQHGRPRKHPSLSHKALSAREIIHTRGGFRPITWRTGTKGPLRGQFSMLRVRIADGPEMAKGRCQPGTPAWLICEKRSDGELRYYFSNYPPETSRTALARTVKARWACEQPHQQMKQELGLNHYEGRSWLGLHHHCLLTMMAFCFLQTLRLRGKKNSSTTPRPLLPACRNCEESCERFFNLPKNARIAAKE